MKRKIFFAVAFLCVIVWSSSRGSDHLLIGAYGALADNPNFTEGKFDTMTGILGLNCYVSGGFNETRTANWYDHGLKIIPYGSFGTEDPGPDTFYIEPQQAYSHASYMIIQAEDQSSYFRFERRVGSPEGDSLWVCNQGNVAMLDSLKLSQENYMSWLYGDDQIEFHPYFRMAMNKQGRSPSDTVAVFKARRFSPDTGTVAWYYITVQDMPDGGLTEVALTPHFHSNDADEYEHFNHISYTFYKTDTTTIKIDYFKIHCQEGKNLVEDRDYDNRIKGSTGRTGFEGKILAWLLKDEPKPVNYRPSAYIDSLIQQAMIDFGWAAENRVRGIQVYGGAGVWGIGDYAKTMKPNIIWRDLYPYFDTACGYPRTVYTGSGWGGPGGTWRGLQWEYNNSLTAHACTTAGVVRDDANVDGWWYFAQGFAAIDGCSDYHYRWRLPTPSELRLAVYVGLCYHPIGLWFYRFNGNTGKSVGLYDGNWNPTRVFYTLKDDIIPYIKAIDTTYMKLTWERAYGLGLDVNGHLYEPPTGAFVDTIYSFSNLDVPNPDADSGWFHVGEFTGANGDPYVMLVNRACSRGPSDSTEAPSITATIRFNDENLGGVHYYYIIDLATGTDSSDWEGVAETTYTALMSDGTIPFTTTFKAGEGRLFRIVAAR